MTGYFYNPNIHPEEEYELRLMEMKKLAEKLGVELFWGEYDADRWFTLTEGLEKESEGGPRCQICFRMRLERAARFARENEFDNFTTTLTISPHKNAVVINRIGGEIEVQSGVNFLRTDFKKRNGFKKTVELSKKYWLYRQDYCGCLYSREERERIRRG